MHVLEDWPLETVIDAPSPLIREIVRRFWPGPLTVVAARAAAIPPVVTAGRDTVGVRAPSDPTARALLAATGAPIAAPSANRFNYISPTTADHVWADLAGRCDLVLDAGPTRTGIESTVIRVEPEGGITLLRHGAVPVEDLRDLAGAGGLSEPAQPLERSSSPGRGDTHYSPRARTVATRRGRAIGEADAPARSPVLLHYDDPPADLPSHWRTVRLGSRADLAGVARDLYARMRDADAMDADLIVAELTEEPGIGRAIDDRLRRAASGRVLGDD